MWLGRNMLKSELCSFKIRRNGFTGTNAKFNTQTAFNKILIYSEIAKVLYVKRLTATLILYRNSGNDPCSFFGNDYLLLSTLYVYRWEFWHGYSSNTSRVLWLIPWNRGPTVPFEEWRRSVNDGPSTLPVTVCRKTRICSWLANYVRNMCTSRIPPGSSRKKLFHQKIVLKLGSDTRDFF